VEQAQLELEEQGVQAHKEIMEEQVLLEMMLLLEVEVELQE